jgi:glycosyltransferase involved in cell wall biosynthesis
MVESIRPIVSVVMITYLHEAFIAEAINGVLMQKCDFDVELMIADDCSPDNTKVVVESFKDHPNVKWINYIRHDSNKGMMRNFVWALEQVSGKYIALCEGDDYWTDPLKLQKQVDFLEGNDEFSGVFHNQLVINSLDGTLWNFVNKRMDPVPEVNQVVVFDDILQGKYRVPTRTILFQRESYDENIFTNEKFLIADLPLDFILTNCKPLFYFNEYMATYRLHENGISNNKDVLNVVQRRIIYFRTWIFIFDWAYHYVNLGKYESYQRGIDRYYKNFIKSNQSVKTNLLIFKNVISLNSKREIFIKEKFRFIIFQSKSLVLFLVKRMLLNKLKSE